MIFVTYSWIDDDPDEKVLSLVEKLRRNGYEAKCDVMYIQKESSIHFAEMMAKNMREAEKVIIVLSEQYKAKANLFKGGVGEEYRYILEDINKKRNKYILVSFLKDRSKVVPDFLTGRKIIYLDSEDSYDILYHHINESSSIIFSEVNRNKTIPGSKRISEMALTEPLHTEQFDTNYRIALANVRKAKIEYESGNIRKANDCYAQAEQQYRELNDIPRLTDVLMNIIILEDILDNNSQKSDFYLNKVRKTFKETGEDRDYHVLAKMGKISSRRGM